MQQQVVIITGGASGIGFGIAEKFARTGCSIAIFDIHLQQAQAAADKLQQAFAVKASAYQVDVTDEAQIEQAVAAVAREFGKIDCLINNAGIQIISELINFQLADWKKVLDIHVNGSFLMSQKVMRQMMKQPMGGKIVFIGSVHSVLASLNKSAYVTSKHAQVGMMRAIAKEGAAYKIAANLVGPGFVRTPLVDKQIPEQAKALGISEAEVVKKVMLGNTLDGEFTTVEEVAKAVLFFANFPGLGVSGQALYVSHGWYM